MDGFRVTYAVIIKTPREVLHFIEKYGVKNECNKEVQWIVIDQSDPEMGIDYSALSKSELKHGYTYGRIRKAMKESGRFVYIKEDPESRECDCWNDVLADIKGDYVVFTNQSVTYEEDTARRVMDAADQFPEESMFFIQSRKKSDKSPIPVERSKAHLEVFDEAQKLPLFPYACFFRTKDIRGKHFRDVCEEEVLFAFWLDFAVKKGQAVFLDNVYCEYTTTLNQKSDRHFGCKNKDYYIPALRDIYLPVVRSFKETGKQVPLWVERILFYEVYFRFYANLNARNQLLLEEEEKPEFFALVKELLSPVSDHLIMNNLEYEQFAPPFPIRNALEWIKYDGDEKKLDRQFFLEDKKLYFQQCGERHDLSRHQKIVIKALNIRNKSLCIDAQFFTHLFYDFSPKAIYAVVNGKKQKLIHTDYYSLDKVFGESVEKKYTFYMEIPLEELCREGADGRIRFMLRLGDEKVLLPVSFNRAPSKLNNRCPHTCWELDAEHILTKENGMFRAVKVSPAQRRKQELRYLEEAVVHSSMADLRQKRKPAKVDTMVRLRRDYFAHRDEMKPRRIWLYFDKLFKAGDNGEYAFRYAFYNLPEIECYYVVNETSPDYGRLTEEFGDSILVYGSYQCLLYALFAELIIATHPDIIEFLGYGRKMTDFMKDLFNAKLVCIAHGVTIQKNADYQNRLFDNTMFYTTSSKYEVAHITRPVYGYHADEVALTGMARFDGLINDDQKQILITPTWRRNLVGSAKRNSTRKYSEEFRSTDYFKIYNALINDERIIETAREHGYRVIFLLHPSMSTQIDDYDRNDYVELIPASGSMSYEEILTQSSLMITDYSGIHYDFGYMRKPIIYYQPKEVPMRFEEGAMKFATMGFGPVCTEYEEAVKLICEQIENGCVMEKKYRDRADDFFAFSDHENSRRIHEAVLEWLDRTR